MPSYDDEYRDFEGRKCSGQERIEPGRAFGSTEPCNGFLVRITRKVFQCDGPRHHLKTAKRLHGQPGLEDVLSGWVPTSYRPEESRGYEVRFPNGSEGEAWWNDERQRWEEMRENEGEGYSTTGAPCEIAGWRPKPTS
jgi:hypothetical protein